MIQVTHFLRHGANVAEHFGFRHVDTFKSHPDCKNCEDKLKHSISNQQRKIDSIYGILTGGLHTFCEEKFHEIKEPILFYSIEQVPRSGEVALTFHVFNVDTSIAEALLIQTMKAFVNELGYEEYKVKINSLGDRDSSNRFARELSTYLRKRIDDMPPSARELMKNNAIYALTHLIEKDHEIAQRAPNPLEYLSDSSRKHFREIIEFLDMAETPYEIDSQLIGHHECYSDALFSIDLYNESDIDAKDPEVIIRGGRFDEFAERNTQCAIPAVGSVVILKNRQAPKRIPRSKVATPSAYVVQLGAGPKMRSLLLIDTLRKARIPVFQNLASNSLSEQLRDAEKKEARYAVIIGHKEYVEETAILRDIKLQNQENVTLPQVVKKLKRLSTV